MGRYLVNKLLHEITLDDGLLQRFRADPAATVGAWEASQLEPLADAERVAATEKDYAALYAMGVHPFVLWCWCYAVLVSDELPPLRLADAYRKAITPFGRPDFTT